MSGLARPWWLRMAESCARPLTSPGDRQPTREIEHLTASVQAAEQECEFFRSLAAQLLAETDKSGFRSASLGVRWADDGTGVARRLERL